MVRKSKLKPMHHDASVTIDVMPFDWLIERLMAHSELLGLTQRQIAAHKKAVRSICWDWYNNQMENPHGFSDPSKQAREEAGLEAKPFNIARQGATTTLSY